MVFLKRMILPTVIMIWSITYFVQTTTTNWKDSALIRPVFYMMIGLYIVNTILDFYECRKAYAKEANTDSKPVEKRKFDIKSLITSNSAILRTIQIVALLFLYATFLNALGYIIATLLLLIILLLLLGVRKPVPLCIFSILVVGVLYIVFKYALSIPLPSGLLSFLGI